MVASEHGTAQGRTSYQDEHNDDCRSFAKSGGRIGNCNFRAERRFIPLTTARKIQTVPSGGSGMVDFIHI